MSSLLLAIACTTLIAIAIVSVWMIFLDKKVDPQYEMCHGCPCGFCIEDPGGDICKEIRREYGRDRD